MLGDSLRRKQPARRPRRSAGRKRRGIRFWLPVLLGVLVVPFAVGYALTVFVLFPAREVAAAGIPVPDLYGLTALEAERALAQAGLGALQVVELPHPTVPEGAVLAQSPLAEQQLQAGRDVRAAVSSGPALVRLPDVLGQPADRAEEALRALGFTVDQVAGESTIEAGRIYAVAPSVGTQAQLPAHATLYVSLGPPPPDSTVLDTLPGLLPDTVPDGR